MPPPPPPKSAGRTRALTSPDREGGGGALVWAIIIRINAEPLAHTQGLSRGGLVEKGLADGAFRTRPD